MQSVLLILSLLVLAVSAAEEKKEVATKFKIFREDCFEAFFTRFDFFSDMSCIKFTISKGIGLAVITGSFIYKVPRIVKICKAQSTKGIQSSAVYFESIVFLHTLATSRHLKLDFTVYGETITILVQQVIIILLIYKYDKDVGMLEKLAFVAFASAYSTVLLTETNVPENAWPLITSSNIIFNILSRLPIIYENFCSKSTGVLAFLTFFMGWAGAVARLGTVLMESDDPMYNAQFIMSTFLNTVIMLQFGLYWNSDDKDKAKTSEVELKDVKKGKKTADTKKSQ